MSEAREVDYQHPALFQPYTNRAELVAEICERLAAGEALASIARDAHMPGWRIIYEWRDSDTELATAIRHAREVGEEAIAARMRRVANGDQHASTGDVMRDKLIIDTDFKLLAKFNPKRWGEATQIRHADAEGGKLDTQPLVGELLSLMGSSVGPASQPAARVTVREVGTTAPIIEPPPGARYVPRGGVYHARPRGSVDDLV